jgi:hypothetical protein
MFKEPEEENMPNRIEAASAVTATFELARGFAKATSATPRVR